MDLWEIYKASKGVPHSGDLYDALMGKALGGAGSVWETESAPYFFRQSGGLLNSRLLGNEKDTIVGASVGWNQLVKELSSSNWASESDVSATYSGGVATVTNSLATNRGIYTPVLFVSGHRYFITAEISVTEAKTYTVGRIGYGVYINKTLPANSGFVKLEGICTASNSGSANFYVYGINGEYTNLKAKNVMCFDLTQMLGSTIADYAYTLETQQSGKGVAWLKSYGFFGLPYYAYDGGSIKSVSGLSAHKCVGFNAWDEEWEEGTINNTTGLPLPDADNIRAKNYCPCKPNTSYFFYSGSGKNLRIYWYDAEQNFISSDTANNAIRVSPDNAYYFKVRTTGYYGDTYNNDICINISNADLNGTYKAYEEHEYPLDSTLELRGMFKMDADHNIYAEGDTYESSGAVSRKYKKVVIDETADISTTQSTPTSGTGFIIRDVIFDSKGNNFLSNMYVAVGSQASISSLNVGEFKVYPNDSSGRIALSDSATTVDALKTKLAQKPLEIVYEAIEPTTDTATPFTSPQNVDKDGTEEYVTTQKFVPIGHETQYKCEPTP